MRLPYFPWRKNERALALLFTIFYFFIFFFYLFSFLEHVTGINCRPNDGHGPSKVHARAHISPARIYTTTTHSRVCLHRPISGRDISFTIAKFDTPERVFRGLIYRREDTPRKQNSQTRKLCNRFFVHRTVNAAQLFQTLQSLPPLRLLFPHLFSARDSLPREFLYILLNNGHRGGARKTRIRFSTTRRRKKNFNP